MKHHAKVHILEPTFVNDLYFCAFVFLNLCSMKNHFDFWVIICQIIPMYSSDLSKCSSKEICMSYVMVKIKGFDVCNTQNYLKSN